MKPLPTATDPDVKLFERIARGFFLLLIVIAIPRYVESAWVKSVIWFNGDETQHYDVIDHLSSGHLHSQRDLISDYTLAISAEYFGFGPAATYDGTRESLHTVGLSYEAQQPPVYYLLLAGPNYLLK